MSRRRPSGSRCFKRQMARAKSFGIEFEFISPAEAGRIAPILRTDDLAGAVWIPGDGKANPTDLTQSLARGARIGGARIVEGRARHRRAHAGRTGSRRRRRSSTAQPHAIDCDVVVNCAGQWARAFGAMAGVDVPLYAAEHFYIVTEPIPGVTPDLPVMRDPDGYIYYKEEVGGLVMGGFEPVAKPWRVDPIPERLRVPAAGRGLGPVRVADDPRDPPHAVPRDRAGEDAAERPGELHRRRQLHPRRGARARRLFRVRRIQLGRHRELGRRRQAGRAMDRRRRGAARPVGRRHPPLRAVPREPTPSRRPHGRVARPALRDALAARGAHDGAAAAPLAAVRPARREGRGVRQQARLGARELFPPAAASASRRRRSARPAGCPGCSTSSAPAARTASCSTRRRSRSRC